MTAPRDKARILVVDDDPGMLRAVSRLLARPYQVATAASGRAALEQLDAFRPDVAILDIRMPEMNGFELMRALHARQPDVDVIIMTGNAEDPDANLIRAISEGAFYFIQKPFDRQVLLTLVARCLELRRLRAEKQQYLRRLEQELNEARQFQNSLLPSPRLTLPGLCVAARYLACSQLAGDFYDYAAAEDGAVTVVIADVVGHGASAAMLTSVVKSAFRSTHAAGYEPRQVVERVKEGMRVFDPSRFVTLTCARIDAGRRELEYVNAGHPAAILHRPAGTVLLGSTGPLVSSALHEVPVAQETLPLEPGDRVLFYTDGVTETASPAGLFGQDRLVSLVQENGTGENGTGESGCGGALDALLDRVLHRLDEFAGTAAAGDDVTLLAVELTADPARR